MAGVIGAGIPGVVITTGVVILFPTVVVLHDHNLRGRQSRSGDFRVVQHYDEGKRASLNRWPFLFLGFHPLQHLPLTPANSAGEPDLLRERAQQRHPVQGAFAAAREVRHFLDGQESVCNCLAHRFSLGVL